MRNKRGGIGDFLSMIVSIIIIVFILGAFVLVSTPLKKFTETPAAVTVYGEEGEEGADLIDYADEEFVDLLGDRFEKKKSGGFG